MNVYLPMTPSPSPSSLARLRGPLAFGSISLAAALLAWFLAAVLQFSDRAVVLTVMVVAFSCSWLVTNRDRPLAGEGDLVADTAAA